jgi:hypothetical protein
MGNHVYFDTPEAGNILGVPASKLRYLRKHGGGPRFDNIGGKIWFDFSGSCTGHG